MQALREHEEAIGVTTYFAIHVPDESTRYEEYQGEFPTSSDPARRFERMLWFFHAGDAKYDPMYGTYRRDVLARTHRLRPSEQTDWLLSVELAVIGPIINLNRAWPTGRARTPFASIAGRSGVGSIRSARSSSGPPSGDCSETYWHWSQMPT